MDAQGSSYQLRQRLTVPLNIPDLDDSSSDEEINEPMAELLPLVQNVEDDLIGQSDSSSNSDDDELFKNPPPAKKTKKTIVPRTKLRDGVAANAVQSAEASHHLVSLPEDYEWISRLPRQKVKPLWTPTVENHPTSTPSFTGRSLCSLFVDMSQAPLNHLLKGTNKLGYELFPKSWPVLTLPKLLKFVAIIFHMDCEKKRNISLYWNKKKPDVFIQCSGISQRQFLKWYRALRPYDPDEYSQFEFSVLCPALRLNPEEKRINKIYKVEEYLRVSQLQMQRMRKPDHQNLSLDEEMSTFKGRCGLIQIIKNKPRGEGLKYYALCDPKTGYIYSTILHSGTPIEFDQVWGRIVAFCYKLITGRPEGSGLSSYIDQGFCIFTDRYYTTVQMNFAMAQRNTYFCGTLRREQRSSLPKEIMMGTRRDPPPQAVKNLKRGEVLRRFSSYGETAAITWMDNTPVTFLTSIDESADDPKIASRMAKTNNGRWFRLGVTQPSVAQEFSANMGGVDVHDQLTTSVKAHHRSKRWYLSAVVLQSLDWFAANSAILFNEFNPSSKVANCKVKESLADTLIDFCNSLEQKKKVIQGDHAFEVTDCNPTTVPPIQHTAKEVRRMRLNRDLPHYPRKFVGKGRECVGHYQRVTSSYFCMVCGVFLCDLGCFARFHEMEQYLYNDSDLDRPILRKTQKY